MFKLETKTKCKNTFLAYLKVWDHSEIVDIVFLTRTKNNLSSGNLMGTSLVTKQCSEKTMTKNFLG